MIKMEQSVRYIVNGIYVTKCYVYVGRMCPQCCKALIRYEKIEISTKKRISNALKIIVEDKWTSMSTEQSTTTIGVGNISTTPTRSRRLASEMESPIIIIKS